MKNEMIPLRMKEFKSRHLHSRLFFTNVFINRYLKLLI